MRDARVHNVTYAECAGKDGNRTVRPILRNIRTFAQPGVVAHLDAHQGHDETKPVRASFSLEFPALEVWEEVPATAAPSYAAGAFEAVLQMYDFAAQRWVDLASKASPAVANSWAGASLRGELTANVPGNTGIRLEIRSKLASRLKISDARITAPICVRDQVSGKCQ
jgi:hypothetical protein